MVFEMRVDSFRQLRVRLDAAGHDFRAKVTHHRLHEGIVQNRLPRPRSWFSAAAACIAPGRAVGHAPDLDHQPHRVTRRLQAHAARRSRVAGWFSDSRSTRSSQSGRCRAPPVATAGPVPAPVPLMASLAISWLHQGVPEIALVAAPGAAGTAASVAPRQAAVERRLGLGFGCTRTGTATISVADFDLSDAGSSAILLRNRRSQAPNRCTGRTCPGGIWRRRARAGPPAADRCGGAAAAAAATGARR